ncbi:MAG: preprotein translocase subunit SecY, partial [Thiotrichales bacterium]
MARTSYTDNLSISGKLTDLKQRVLFVIFGVIIYRFGAYIPIPGVNPELLEKFFHNQSSSLFGLFNMFSGGALYRFSIFSLGIMPYISASIIMQILSSVSPTLEELKKSGEAGRNKIMSYTRYATFVLALVQSFGISRYIASNGLSFVSPWQFYCISVLTLTAGSVFLMWLGEQITERGIGNGVSLLIFASIISGLPRAIFHTIEQARNGNLSIVVMLLVFLTVIGVVAFVIFFERAQRKIPVYYANRQYSGKNSNSYSSHLPLKINMAGVIPAIFATSILVLPSTLSTWFASYHHMGWLSLVSLYLSYGQPLYVVLFVVAV